MIFKSKFPGPFNVVNSFYLPTKILLAFIVFSAVSLAWAGEITLNNGESLRGDIDSVRRDSVQWQTESIGIITIPKDQIANIQSDSKMKVYGVDESCFWQGINAGDVLLTCGDEKVVYRSFKSLNNVVRETTQRVDGVQFNGNILGVGTSSSGNKSEENWLLDIDTTVRHSDYRHISGAKYETESVEGNGQEEEYELAYALDWFFSRRTYLFVSTTAGRDETREFDARYTFGTGLGYQFWDNTKSALSIQTGGEYVRQEPIDPVLEEEEYESWQVSSNYRYAFFRDIRFYLKASATYSLQDGDDWYGDAETGLSMPLIMGVTADVKYEFDYDNTPIDGLRKADSAFRVGFGYAW